MSYKSFRRGVLAGWCDAVAALFEYQHDQHGKRYKTAKGDQMADHIMHCVKLFLWTLEFEDGIVSGVAASRDLVPEYISWYAVIAQVYANGKEQCSRSSHRHSKQYMPETCCGKW